MKIAEDKNHQGLVLEEDIERSELGRNGLFFLLRSCSARPKDFGFKATDESGFLAEEICTSCWMMDHSFSEEMQCF